VVALLLVGFQKSSGPSISEIPKKWSPLYQRDSKKVVTPILKGKISFKKAVALLLVGFQKVVAFILMGFRKSGCPYINVIILLQKAAAPLSKGFFFFFFKKVIALILKGFQKSSRPSISGISKKRSRAVLSLLKGKRQGGFYFSKAICD
jgi:hypothetical protein